MNKKTLDIDCLGYSVKADLYAGDDDRPILLSLIGRSSHRTKPHHKEFLTRLANELNITSLIFDYSGHGDSPFDINELCPAQHFLEVIHVFDWLTNKYPNRKIFVIGSSYGGFLATQLTKYRAFDFLVLRAPAIYRPSDFYTQYKNEDSNAAQIYRRDVEALSQHSVLTRAVQFEGGVLLVVNENDERIPKATTDAYVRTFKPDVIIAKDFPHSLDDIDEQQKIAYFQKIFVWIKGKSE